MLRDPEAPEDGPAIAEIDGGVVVQGSRDVLPGGANVQEHVGVARQPGLVEEGVQLPPERMGLPLRLGLQVACLVVPLELTVPIFVCRPSFTCLGRQRHLQVLDPGRHELQAQVDHLAGPLSDVLGFLPLGDLSLGGHDVAEA